MNFDKYIHPCIHNHNPDMEQLHQHKVPFVCSMSIPHALHSKKGCILVTIH